MPIPSLARIGARSLVSTAFLLVATLALGAPAVLAAPPSGSVPAVDGWSVRAIIEPDGTNNMASFAVTGAQSGVIAYRSSKTAYVRWTTDGGTTWSARRQVSLPGKTIMRVTMSTYGRHVDVLHETMTTTYLRHSGDGGRTWDTTRTVEKPGALPVIARGPDGLMVMLGLDPQGPRWRVTISQNGGRTWGAAKTVGRWELTGGDNPLAAVAVAESSIVVLFRNQDQRLVTRRSTDKGISWSGATTIGSSAALWASTFGVDGSTVVVAYDQPSGGSERLVVRRSIDGGGGWSSPVLFGVDVTGAAVGHDQGDWHLVSSDQSGTWRYRSSDNGLAWSDAEVVDTGHDVVAPPIGVGAFVGGPAAAWWDELIYFSE